MRGKWLLLGLLVGTVLLAGAVAPAAAQSDPDASSICPGGGGDNLVLLLPNGTAVQPGDSITLYAGTEGELLLCSNGEYDVNPTGSRWSVNGDAIDGMTVEGVSKYRYEITIADVSGPVEVGFDAEGAISTSGVNTPDVTATPGAASVVNVGDAGPYRVSFADADRRSRYDTANDTYASSADAMRTAAARIKAEGTAVDDDRVADLERIDELRGSYATVQRALFAAAENGDDDAVAALGAYADHRSETLASVRGDLREANTNLATRAGDRAEWFLLNLFGFVLVGAVVGGVAGRYVTGNILGEVAHKRSRSSAVDFSPRQLAWQLVASVLLLAAAAGLAWYVELFDALAAAFQAVIGL